MGCAVGQSGDRTVRDCGYSSLALLHTITSHLIIYVSAITHPAALSAGLPRGFHFFFGGGGGSTSRLGVKWKCSFRRIYICILIFQTECICI